MKRLRPLIAALFAASILVTPATAAPVKPVVAPAITANEIGNCSPLQSVSWLWAQNSTSNGSQSRSGVLATLNLASTNAFSMCNGIINWGDAVSAWVSIEPCPDCLPHDGTRILQVGVLEGSCLWPGGACFGPNNPHFFWAWGGCTEQPVPLDMGPADYGTHTYSLYLDASLYWHFQIDGAAQGTPKHKLLPNSYVSCWTGGLRQAKWSGERHDDGDSYGDANDRSVFTVMRYGVFNQGWFNPLNQTAFFTRSDDRAVIESTDSFSFWTDD